MALVCALLPLLSGFCKAESSPWRRLREEEGRGGMVVRVVWKEVLVGASEGADLVVGMCFVVREGRGGWRCLLGWFVVEALGASQPRLPFVGGCGWVGQARLESGTGTAWHKDRKSLLISRTFD